MQWKDVVADPHLQDLPFKIETNEWGQIVMSPTRLQHGNYQTKIAVFLTAQMGESGEVVTKCAVQTRMGTKVADVAWFSAERWVQVKDEYDSPVAPEICVEVLSPSNSSGEIEQKKMLYFERGADEIWICDADGAMTFYTQNGVSTTSALVPDFPTNIL